MPDSVCPFPGNDAPGQSRDKPAPTIYYAFSQFLIPNWRPRRLLSCSSMLIFASSVFSVPSVVNSLLPEGDHGYDQGDDGYEDTDQGCGAVGGQLLFVCFRCEPGFQE